MAGETGGEFEERVLALQTELYHFALSLTGNAPDASDLLQDTFVKVFRNRGSFQPGTNLKAWIARIMRNTFIDQRRRKRYEPVPVETVEEAPVRRRTGEALRSLLPDTLPEYLSRALKELDPDHRALLVLCDVHGYRYREIAEILGIPMGTCMSRIHRARRKLRDKLSGR